MNTHFDPFHKKFKSRICRHWLKGHCKLHATGQCNFAHGWDEVQQFSPKGENEGCFIFGEMTTGEEIRSIGGHFSPASVMEHFSVGTSKEHIDKEKNEYIREETILESGNHIRKISSFEKGEGQNLQCKKNIRCTSNGVVWKNHNPHAAILPVNNRWKD